MKRALISCDTTTNGLIYVKLKFSDRERSRVGKIIGEIMTEKFPKSFKNYKPTDQEIQ